MEEEFEPSGLKVREALDLIRKAQENKEYIMLPGQFWDGCDYNKVLLEEKKRMKPKKSTPMQILIQQQFLVDQGKTKKAEQAWFDKLEDELERMEMDELLVQFKLENAQKKINKDVSNIEANSEQDLKDRQVLMDQMEQMATESLLLQITETELLH